MVSGSIFVLLGSLLSVVPDEAGGAPEASQRPTRQSVRAAGRVGPRAGAEQPQTVRGQPWGPAADPGVSSRFIMWCFSL